MKDQVDLAIGLLEQYVAEKPEHAFGLCRWLDSGQGLHRPYPWCLRPASTLCRSAAGLTATSVTTSATPTCGAASLPT